MGTTITPTKLGENKAFPDTRAECSSYPESKGRSQRNAGKDRWKELEKKEEVVQMLQQKGKQLTVTLVYAAQDEVHNGALALKWFLEGHT